MLQSVILRSATRILQPLLLMLALFILFRGHNEPGGGFIGGLVAAASFALTIFAEGEEEARRVLRVHPRMLIASGLLTAVLSGIYSLLRGQPFMTSQGNYGSYFPIIGRIGPPLIFDIGVFLVVIGVVMTIVVSLFEDEET